MSARRRPPRPSAADRPSGLNCTVWTARLLRMVTDEDGRPGAFPHGGPSAPVASPPVATRRPSSENSTSVQLAVARARQAEDPPSIRTVETTRRSAYIASGRSDRMLDRRQRVSHALLGIARQLGERLRRPRLRGLGARPLLVGRSQSAAGRARRRRGDRDHERQPDARREATAGAAPPRAGWR